MLHRMDIFSMLNTLGLLWTALLFFNRFCDTHRSGVCESITIFIATSNAGFMVISVCQFGRLCTIHHRRCLKWTSQRMGSFMAGACRCMRCTSRASGGAAAEDKAGTKVGEEGKVDYQIADTSNPMLLQVEPGPSAELELGSNLHPARSGRRPAFSFGIHSE